MEFCAGGSLGDVIKERASKALTEDETSAVLLRVIKGLAYLHKMGITHRDLKARRLLHDSVSQNDRF